MDDLLSRLPDDVLCHVLSFLTTKEASLTSVLSKRWRNLLASVPTLDIDEARDGTRKTLVGFIDRVLSLQGKSPMNKFTLKIESELDMRRVYGWLSNALARDVSELDIKCSSYMEHEFLKYSKRFKNVNLVKMTLRGLTIGWFAEGVVLPMLRTLVLDTVWISADEFCLTSALPKLEELVLVDIFWEENDITVSSASVKSLTMNSRLRLGSMSFDTPSLVYFCYSGSAAKDYRFVKMVNLVEARISVLVTKSDVRRARAPYSGVLEYNMDVVNVEKLMDGIRNVQYMDLSPDTLEMLSLCCDSVPVFNNLKSLTIKSDESRGWQAMPLLLRNSPRLETLLLKGLLHKVTDKCGDVCDCVPQKNKGLSLISCRVKVLEIQEFQGTVKEMHMVKHFLNNFWCLKEIKIFVKENGPTQSKILEVSKWMAEMMELYSMVWSCSVQLMVSGQLYKKWTAQ